MPPVFGPLSPSPSRLWSRAAGSAIASLAVAQGDDARLGAVQPFLDDDARAGASRRTARRARRRRPRRASQTVTPLPAARPSSLTTTPARPRRARATRTRPPPTRVVQRPARGHPDAGRGGDLVAERLATISIAGRRPRRPEDRDPGASMSASATPAASGASGPTTTSSAAIARARATTRRASSGSTSDAAHPRLARRCASLPGRDDDLVHARLAGELPGQRVLPAATADDQDPGRHQRRLMPARPAGGASGARPARWSGSAPARPRRGRSGRRRAPRWRTRSAGRSRAGRPASGRRGSARTSPGTRRRSASRATSAAPLDGQTSTRRPSIS